MNRTILVYLFTYISLYTTCTSSVIVNTTSTTNNVKNRQQQQALYVNYKEDKIITELNKTENISTIMVDMSILDITKMQTLMTFITTHSLKCYHIIFYIDKFNNDEFVKNYNTYINNIRQTIPSIGTIEYISNTNGGNYHYLYTQTDHTSYTSNNTDDMLLNLMIWLWNILPISSSQEKIILDFTSINNEAQEKILKDTLSQYTLIEKIEITLPEQFTQIPLLNNVLKISEKIVISCNMNNIKALSDEMVNKKNINSTTEALCFKINLSYTAFEECLLIIDKMYNTFATSKLEHIELSLTFDKDLNEKEQENIYNQVKEFNTKHNREELLNINIVKFKEI